MRPQKALDKEVINGLTEVFCSKGYEGASLQDLAAASGLKKASLYHRFPDGKKEMADAVFLHLHDFIQQNVFDVLQDDNLKPEVRLQIALDNIAVLYDGGKRTDRKSTRLNSSHVKISYAVFCLKKKKKKYYNK